MPSSFGLQLPPPARAVSPPLAGEPPSSVTGRGPCVCGHPKAASLLRSLGNKCPCVLFLMPSAHCPRGASARSPSSGTCGPCFRTIPCVHRGARPLPLQGCLAFQHLYSSSAQRVSSWRGIAKCPLFIPSYGQAEQLGSEWREVESCPTTQRRRHWDFQCLLANQRISISLFDVA